MIREVERMKYKEFKEEVEKETFDLITHRLKVIQTNSEDVMSWEDIVNWADIVSWMSKEIEKNRNLKNNLGDIIRELEEYKNTHSMQGVK